MKSTTAWLLLALAILVAGGTAALRGDGARTRLPDSQPLFPALAAQLPRAQRVEITHGGTRLIVARNGESWGIPDRADYPVDASTLHALLAGLAELRLLEPRTSDPDFFARLGVQDPAAPGADGTLVRVLAADGGVIATVILGHAVLAGQGDAAREDIYVRRPSERQSWLAQPAVSASADWQDWVARRIIDIRPDDVARIVSRRGDAAPIEVERAGGTLVVTSPARHPPLDQFKVEDMTRALASLDMLDVRPALGAPGTPLGEATISTVAGLQVTADLARDGDAVWLTLRAAGDSGAAPAASDLQSRVAGWSFSIEPRKESALLPTLADLAAYAPPMAASAPPAAPDRPTRR
jgi:hypothetical protein